MIRFACPKCHKKFQVEDKAAGKKTKCLKCGAAISIPSDTSTLISKHDGSQLSLLASIEPSFQTESTDDLSIRPPCESHNILGHIDTVEVPTSSDPGLTSVQPNPEMQKPANRSSPFISPFATAFVLGGATVLAVLALTGSLSVLQRNGAHEENSNSPEQNISPQKTYNQNQKPGKVRVNVTYEYNKFVGNKPDTNSIIVLVPKSFKGKLKSKGIVPGWNDAKAIDEVKKDFRKQGVFLGIVGGNGVTLIGGVSPGDYWIYIISKHTNDSVDNNKVSESMLSRHFSPSSVFYLHKVHDSEITVESGEETEYTFDFGNTYIDIGD